MKWLNADPQDRKKIERNYLFVDKKSNLEYGEEGLFLAKEEWEKILESFFPMKLAINDRYDTSQEFSLNCTKNGKIIGFILKKDIHPFLLSQKTAFLNNDILKTRIGDFLLSDSGWDRYGSSQGNKPSISIPDEIDSFCISIVEGKPVSKLW